MPRLLPFRADLSDLANLEVAYAPPFAAALDIVNAVANTAENILDGLNRTVDVAEFEKCFLEEKAPDSICLDVRGAANAAPYVDLFGDRWRNIPQETLKHRLAEIPQDKRLLVVCNSGVRSFEALRQLETAELSGQRAGRRRGPQKVRFAGFRGRRGKRKDLKVA